MRQRIDQIADVAIQHRCSATKSQLALGRSCEDRFGSRATSAGKHIRHMSSTFAPACVGPNIDNHSPGAAARATPGFE
jgi:hypothetical protein